jgi:hypothetical protein
VNVSIFQTKNDDFSGKSWSSIMLAYIPYLFINLIFVLKYSQRVTSHYFLVCIFFALVSFAFLFCLKPLINLLKKTSVWLFLSLIGVLMVAAILQSIIDPYQLQVDRWSAIHFFLRELLQGNYPYMAGTHLGGYGSPFPVWQLFHLPFYLLGNVGLSFFVVSFLFIYSIYKFYGSKTALCIWLLLVMSPAYWYESVVRSDLITNIMLSATIVVWLKNKEIKLSEHIVSLAVLMGLLASTRFISLVPVAALYGISFLNLSFKKQFQLVSIVVLVFVLTFLPFLLWKGESLLFFEYNPFVLQTRQGSPLVLLFFAIVAVFSVIYASKRGVSLYLLVAYLLNFLVVTAFVEKMILNDAWEKLFTPMFDITYLSVALPFYVLYLGLHKKLNS